jgi:putative transposase
MDGLQFFDRKQPFTVAWRKLPHWSQAGTVCFITWRTGDSLPIAAQMRIRHERAHLLKGAGLNPQGDWRAELARLPALDAVKLRWQVFAAWASNSMLEPGSAS